MKVSEFISQLRERTAAEVGGVRITRPALETNLDTEPLMVMEQMLGADRTIHAAMQEKTEGTEHTYHIATNDGRLLQFVISRIATEGKVCLRVHSRNFLIARLAELAYEADCAAGIRQATAWLDFGQAKPYKIKATDRQSAEELRRFVGALRA